MSSTCHNTLQEAEACYNSGDFENALLLFHKGHKMRPNATEFKVGISKTKNALRIIFLDHNSRRSASSVSRVSARSATRQDLRSATSTKTRSSARETTASSTAVMVADLDRNNSMRCGSSYRDNSTYLPIPSLGSDGLSEYQTEWIRAAIAARRQPISMSRHPKYRLESESKEEVRNIRVKLSCRPKDNMDDDYEFLKMFDRKWDKSDEQVKVQKLTKNAINFMDSRNQFWTQQIPHHLKERSYALQDSVSKDTPLSVATIHAYIVKEFKRIHAMMKKEQWFRSLDKARNLFHRISELNHDVPNRDKFYTNCCSMIGNCCLELERYEESLEYHLKDLKMAKECDLTEAQSRAMSNVARAHLKMGENLKAIEIWEEKVTSNIEMTPEEEAWLYHDMGHCYQNVGKPRKAKMCGEKSLSAAEQSEQPQLQFNAVILIAQANLKMGQASTAKSKLEEGLVLAQEIDDKEAQKVLQKTLADVETYYREWGDSDEYSDISLSHHPQQLLQEETLRLNHLLKQCKFQQVIDESKKLMDLLEDLKEEVPNKSSVLVNYLQLIGNSYLGLGQHDNALQYYQKGVELAEESELKDIKVQTLAYAGRPHARKHEYEKAIAVWDEIAEEKVVSPHEYPWLFYEKGYCYIETGRPEQALDCGQTLMAATTDTGEVQWQLNARLLVAQSLLSMGEAFKSRDAFLSAMKLAKQTNSIDAQGKIEEALKEIEEVLQDYMQHQKIQVKYRQGFKRPTTVSKTGETHGKDLSNFEKESDAKLPVPSARGHSVKFKDKDESSSNNLKGSHSHAIGVKKSDHNRGQFLPLSQKSKSFSDMRTHKESKKPLRRECTSSNLKSNKHLKSTPKVYKQKSGTSFDNILMMFGNNSNAHGKSDSRTKFPQIHY